MKRTVVVFRPVRLALLVLTAAGVNVCAGSSHETRAFPYSVPSLEQLDWAVADFDGDNQPDIAITTARGRGGYVLDLELSTRPRGDSLRRTAFPSLPWSAFGWRVLPRDVDDDDDLDIVVVSGFDGRPVAVWINDGEGGFEPGDVDAYPARVWLGDVSLSPAIARTMPVLFGPSRASRFSLKPGTGARLGVGHSGMLVAPGTGLPICVAPSYHLCARAPPGKPLS